jgi:hypothetical protein
MDATRKWRWWKDPILIAGAVVIMSLVFGSAGFMVAEHYQDRFDREVTALGEWAKAVDYPGNSKEALERHEAVLAHAGDRQPRALAAVNAVYVAKQRVKDLRSFLGDGAR